VTPRPSRILVVENEGIISKDIALRLRTLGYEVTGIEAYGESAVEHSRASRPDLVLMDIELGGPMDGIEAATIITSTLNVPVVYLTANADQDVMDRARLTEPFGYLIKPFESRELHSTIQMALYKHAMGEQVRRTRDQYRHFLESVSAIPWEFDLRADRFTYVGPQAERILGYPPSAWTGQAFWGSLIHVDDRDAAIALRREHMAGGEPHDMEYRVIARTGGVVWIRDLVSVITDARGAARLLGFMQDVTPYKEAEAEREHLIVELKDALACVKTLRGLLPICAWCKKIRDDKGYWTQVETYVKEHSDAEFTHGICPECIARMDTDLDASKGGKRPGEDPGGCPPEKG
jgi:PAS domain S-box-containing protein